MTRAPAISEIAPLLIGVQTHPERDVSLDSLANEHGYSPSHFHRLFTEAVGETPKAHIERVRLERAAYRLSVTRESVLDIALSVGFQNHETFSRAFKRRFRYTPSAWRRASIASQTQWVERNRLVRHDGCDLSEVSFLTLKPMTLLAMRRMGKYGTFGAPDFDGAPSDWSPLFETARSRRLPFRRLAMVICYDSPTLTPPHLQALGACVPLVKPEGAPRKGNVRRLDFTGGLYGAIEHRGPVKTLEHAYRTLAFGINRSGRFVLRDGPPLEILRELSIDGDPNKNLNEIYLPVEPVK
jgi:AraC family transcriptional regulator